MRETSRHLDEAGLVHAGVGENRAQARAPRYLETPRGRIALVSMASSFRGSADALPPSTHAPGRPGLSPVRTTRTTVVPEDVFDTLRKTYERTERAKAEQGEPPPRREEPAEGLTLFGESSGRGIGSATSTLSIPSIGKRS